LIEKFGKYSATKETSFLVLVPKLESESNKLSETLGMVVIQAEDTAGALHQFSTKIPKLEKPTEPEKKSENKESLSDLIKRGTKRIEGLAGLFKNKEE